VKTTATLLSRRRVRLTASARPALYGRVYAKRGARSLAHIAAVFALNKTETGRLFGISRQSVDGWYTKGVPMGRVADVGRTADLAAALNTRFKAERIPQIVRSPLPGLNNDTVLEAIPKYGTVRIFEMLDYAFPILAEAKMGKAGIPSNAR
jgi:hypothetical protein